MLSHWEPDPRWEGQEAYILGGGPSLTSFDMNLLKGRNVIGCNDAYKLGVEICPVVYFIDPDWYGHHYEHLKTYQGELISCRQDFLEYPEIKTTKRFDHGLHLGGVGYNGNSGAGAINLAILFGAAKIYLLGFDMELGGAGQANWHQNEVNQPDIRHYQRFQGEFKDFVIPDWKKKFSHIGIVNLNPDSKLDGFPKEDWRDHQWQE